MNLVRIARGSTTVTLLTLSISVAVQAAWEPVNLPSFSARTRSLAIAPSQPTRLMLGMQGLGVSRSDDRGLSWVSVSEDLPSECTVSAIVISPANPDRAWAAVDGVSPGLGVVWATTDAGLTWSAGTGIGSRFFQDLFVHSGDPNILIVSTFTGSVNRIQRSSDAGATWIVVPGFTQLVYEFSSHPSTPDLVLGATLGGMARSTDGGLSWNSPSGTGYRNVAFAPSDPNRVFAASGFSIRTSTNAGATFSNVGVLPVTQFDYVQDELAVRPTDWSGLVAAGQGYGFPCSHDLSETHNAFVFRSTNGGVNWTETRRDCCPSDEPTELAYDPQEPNRVYFGSVSKTGDGLAVSESGGASGSWTPRVQGLSNFTVAEIEGDVAGTNYVRTEGGVYRSAGDVSTWTAVWTASGADLLSSLVVNKTDPSNLWESGTIANCFGGESQFVRRSTNSGATWTSPGSGLPSGLDIRFHTNHGDGTVVYATTLFGLYRSTNGGTSFVLASSGSHYTSHLAIDPTDAARLFLARFASPQVALSEDGGATFEPRDSGLPPALTETIVDLFMRRADPDYLAVLYANGEVWESFDAGIGWTRRFALDVTAFSVLQSTWDEASGHVFFATLGGGVASTNPNYVADGLSDRTVVALHWDPVQSVLLAGVQYGGLWKQSIAEPVGAVETAATRPFQMHVSPNPVRDRTWAEFEVPAGGAHVSADVYDAAGRRVCRLLDAPLPGGPRRLTWNAQDEGGTRLGSGVYFLKVRAGEAEAQAKIILLR